MIAWEWNWVWVLLLTIFWVSMFLLGWVLIRDKFFNKQVQLQKKHHKKSGGESGGDKKGLSQDELDIIRSEGEGFGIQNKDGE